MQRTGGMRRTRWLMAVVAAWAGCGGDDGGAKDGSVGDGDGALIDSPIDSPFDPPIDAPRIDAAVPIDATTDASGCGTDLRLVGEYLDWDSTNAGFLGIASSSWSVVGDPTRSAMTQPNGTLVLCLSPAGISQITVSGPAPYLPALFLADAAVFSPAGSRFEARGLKMGIDAVNQYLEFGQPFQVGFAQILVYKIGAPIPLALAPVINPPQRNFVSDGPNDITWSDGDTGTFTLFTNRPVNVGTATLTSTVAFTGPTTIPIAGGRFTIVVIR